MIGLIQRVTRASVEVEEESIATINEGILLLLGVEKGDSQQQADRLLQRVITYRIFEDDTGRMNKSLVDIKGELLVVPQFTLPADTKKGTRPSFGPAAPPELGKHLFDYFLQQSENKLGTIQSGQFGADMQVSLINNGPVTFWLQC
ncbi:MAG TPA: D-tyrosyl-tRNA(Tyr) deacylase [Leucothrix mucor]|nr:D-tyrosyl-tRNA(Tyr) deacylase [Leucothrix mucor]